MQATNIYELTTLKSRIKKKCLQFRNKKKIVEKTAENINKLKSYLIKIYKKLSNLTANINKMNIESFKIKEIIFSKFLNITKSQNIKI